MKKLAILAAVPATLVCLGAAPAFANASGGYGSQPGQAVAFSHTTCAGAGAFGYYGNGHNEANMAGGADGQATGINNSSLCGNPQGH